MTRFKLAVTSLSAVLFLAAGGVALSQANKQDSAQWQYLEVQLSMSSSQPLLDRYGAEGWELVNVVSACSGGAGCEWWAYFKRRR